MPGASGAGFKAAMKTVIAAGEKRRQSNMALRAGPLRRTRRLVLCRLRLQYASPLDHDKKTKPEPESGPAAGLRDAKARTGAGA